MIGPHRHHGELASHVHLRIRTSVQIKKRLVSRSVNESLLGFIRVLLCSYESEKVKASFSEGRPDLTVLLDAVCFLSLRVKCLHVIDLSVMPDTAGQQTKSPHPKM